MIARAAALVVIVAAAQSGAGVGRLNVCHAGSLSAAFARVEKAFAAKFPSVVLTDTSGGSVDLGRRLATGTLSCDVYAPADDQDIAVLLKPARLADYTIAFAEGRMVLAYLATDPKARALAVTGEFQPPTSIPAVAAAWYETLTAPGVRIAGAHPFLDPGGYRSHLIFELAQTYYRMPGLYNALLAHYTVIPADPSNPAGAPALGRDYNFQVIYEHSAAAAARANASYRYARLPVEIDLSDPNRRSYGDASVTIPGIGTPGSAPMVTIHGSRVTWGVTVVKNSPNESHAIAFLAMLLGPEGAAALRIDGPSPISPARVTRADSAKLPAPLTALTAPR